MNIIILAGGSGTRLWPYSRTVNPKQFLSLEKMGFSLFQETCRRIASLAEENNIWIIGSQKHAGILYDQVEKVFPSFNQQQILLEPLARNTAPAILWGLLHTAEPDEPVLILPSDHLIQEPSVFLDAVQKARRLADESWLVTFGIQTEQPETGYGYIQAGSPLQHGFQVKRFVEKPDLETAKRLIQSGDYTWNAGIFLATQSTFLQEFQRHAPEIYQVFDEALRSKMNFSDSEAMTPFFQKVPSNSMDYAILEKSSQIAVLPVEKMKWSDLGSWESWYQVSQKDKDGNLIQGDVICQETQNSFILSTKRLVTSLGVENLLIVESEDAILVCDLRRSQEIKKLVTLLEKEKRSEY